jgi:gluconokinase
MGVEGSGKTSVGQLLAQTLGWMFVDADDFHSASNKEKMSRGVPLDDADRGPWLWAIHDFVQARTGKDKTLCLPVPPLNRAIASNCSKEWR